MSSRPAAASAAEISSVHVVPSGLTSYAFKSLATSSLAPWGRLLMAMTASSMVKVLLGAM